MTDDSSSQPAPTLAGLLLDQSQAMAAYAVSLGLPLPAEVTVIEASAHDLQRLAALHAKLSKLIEPATPDVVTEMYRDHKIQDTSTNRFVLWMFSAGIAALALLVVGASLSSGIDLNLDLLELGSWDKVLIKLAYVFGAAGIGAAFSTLFQINSYAVRKAFNPAYQSVYWVKFALGLVAGLLLVEFVRPKSGVTVGSLALLGGFASTVVYRMVKRLTSALESVFYSDMEEFEKASAQVASAQADATVMQANVASASLLTQLRGDLTAQGVPDTSLTSLDQFISELLNRPEGVRIETAKPTETAREVAEVPGSTSVPVPSPTG